MEQSLDYLRYGGELFCFQRADLRTIQRYTDVLQGVKTATVSTRHDFGPIKNSKTVNFCLFPDVPLLIRSQVVMAQTLQHLGVR